MFLRTGFSGCPVCAKSDQTARTADFGGRLAELWGQCVVAQRQARRAPWDFRIWPPAWRQRP